MSIWNLMLFLVFMTIISHPMSYARTFMRCEMSRQLVDKYKINKTFLSNWICMIEHESMYDTKKIERMNGITKYGLFQIDDKEFCGKNTSRCTKNCRDFLDDNIDDDVACAKLIFEEKGFQHWRSWKNVCKNRQNLPNLNLACKIHELPSSFASNTQRIEVVSDALKFMGLRSPEILRRSNKNAS